MTHNEARPSHSAAGNDTTTATEPQISLKRDVLNTMSLRQVETPGNLDVAVSLHGKYTPSGLYAYRRGVLVPVESSAYGIERQAKAGDTPTYHLLIDVSATVEQVLDTAIADMDAAEAPESQKSFRFQFVLALTPGYERDTESTAPDIVYVPLGRAHKTHLTDNVTFYERENKIISPYVSKEGIVTVGVNKPPKPYARIYNDGLTLKDGKLYVKGRIFSRHTPIQTAELVILARRSDYKVSIPLEIKPMLKAASERRGRRGYGFSAEYDFTQDFDKIPDDAADFYVDLHITDSGEKLRKRFGKSRYRVRANTKGTVITQGSKAVAIEPYYTYSAKNPSIQFELFSNNAYQAIQKKDNHPDVTLFRKGARPIWVIGEMAYRAQDNGRALFAYVRENHPEIDAYYVIDVESPEAANVLPYGNVLDFRSKEHVAAVLNADKIIATHQPTSLFPTRSASFQKRVKADLIFLQHGVTAGKWMVPYAGKYASDMNTDLVIVSSEREKEFFVRDFKYAPEEVAVTGFPRFDALFDDKVEVATRQLMVMPTWRAWLQDPEAFVDSEYYHRWSMLLADPDFLHLVKKHDLEVILCLHPNMRQYAEQFQNLGIRVVLQGEVDIQRLIKESGVMITDYSSVGFDFSFLHKPVLFYQFDSARFPIPHADPLTELPGPVVTSQGEINRWIDRTYEADARIPAEYAARANVFVENRDTNNSLRTFEAVRDFKRKRRPASRFLTTDFGRTVARRFQRSKRVRSLLRFTYRLMRLLPMDDNTIVFESNLGRAFGDSPRAIYEEMSKRQGHWKFIVVSNKRIRLDDPRTTVVRRNSAQFFWHLARARFWVNNHNFPHFIKRRRRGVYIQTWHGTPLKKMFRDQNQIVGRDSGYVNRVTRASNQWSHLVSPSNYASEKIRSAYNFSGPSYELGYPRNDVLSSENRDRARADIVTALGLDPSRKVVLYAPTFRDNVPTTRGRFGFVSPLSFERFSDEFGEDAVLLLRTHLLVNQKSDIPEHLRGRVVDVSHLPDMQPLLAASDVLITDYSSSFFDFAILRRPIIFYAYDLSTYRDELRGFYLDYEKNVPGPIATTEDELFQQLKEGLYHPESFPVPDEAFVERFAPHDDGGAARRVAERFFDISGD